MNLVLGFKILGFLDFFGEYQLFDGRFPVWWKVYHFSSPSIFTLVKIEDYLRPGRS